MCTLSQAGAQALAALPPRGRVDAPARLRRMNVFGASVIAFGGFRDKAWTLWGGTCLAGCLRPQSRGCTQRTCADMPRRRLAD